MGSITIRNLPDEALRSLGIRAAQEGVSREELARRTLLRATDADAWGQELQRIRERTRPPAGLAENDVREGRSETRHARPIAYGDAPRQQSLLPVAGSGTDLWGKDSTRTIRKLRDEWSR